MRQKREKNKFILLLILLFVLTVGIGYAILTEQLTINNTISYDSMKWDVGFTAAEDGYKDFVDATVERFGLSDEKIEELGVTKEEFVHSLLFQGFEEDEIPVIASADAVLSPDKKSVAVNCDLEMTSKMQLCFVKVTVHNAGSLIAELTSFPSFEYDENFVNSVSMWWLRHDSYGTLTDIYLGQTIAPDESVELLIFISMSELTADMLPEDGMSIPVTVSLDFKDAPVDVSQLAMLIPYDAETSFWFGYSDYILNLFIEDEINPPENYLYSYELSVSKDGKIMGYLVPNASEYGCYDFYIQSNETIYANFDMSGWFNFPFLKSVSGLELIDTTYLVNADYMFNGLGSNRLDSDFNAVLTIKNPNLFYYDDMFANAAIRGNSQITLNYTSDTESIVDQILSEKDIDSHIVKGNLVR